MLSKFQIGSRLGLGLGLGVLLALSAAVEAARAGEQGRGFAVAASAVRSLAGQPADAAKEIKTLIGASVERVEACSRQADAAGAAMSDIVSQVQRVTQLISEFSNAAGEQATGIGQAGEAVMQLNPVTQQNDARAEQSAATAQSHRFRNRPPRPVQTMSGLRSELRRC